MRRAPSSSLIFECKYPLGSPWLRARCLVGLHFPGECLCWLSLDVKRGNVYFMHILIMHSFAFFSPPSGSSTQIRHLALRSLLPNTDQYMTYEGSTTHPGCWESTVWIILNKPIYITKQEVSWSKYFSSTQLVIVPCCVLDALSALCFEKTYAGIRTNAEGTTRQQC